MAHIIKNKKKMLARVRRLRGQVEGIERALDEERDCSEILQTIAACRGAFNSLMAEIIEGHIRFHIVNPDRDLKPHRDEAVEELIDVVNAYLK
ncbi:MAG TPA: metal/formaldehyde-sensitive transcriptional repressor [Terriglobia bacterium]|nr:metal/formaldehyde-sensitive transcriptional repressor [Terriglobia bacterium]